MIKDGQQIADREAKAVVQDLRERLPDLWNQVKLWQLAATKKHESCQLLRACAGEKEIPPNLLESGLKGGLLSLPENQDYDTLPRLPANIETPQDVMVCLLRTATTRDSLKELRRSRDELAQVYTKLEDMLIPSRLRQTLLENRCSRCPVLQDYFMSGELPH